MNNRRGYVQIGSWQVKKWFIWASMVVFAWVASDISRLKAIAPFSDSLPPALPPLTSVSGTQWSDAVGKIELYAIGTAITGSRMEYWHSDGTAYDEPSLPGYYSPIYSSDKRNRWNSFYFQLDPTAPAIDDIQFRFEGGRLSRTEWSGQRLDPNGRIDRTRTRAQLEMYFPEEATKGTVSLGIAAANKAVALAETPLPGRWALPRGKMPLVIREGYTLDPSNVAFSRVVKVPELPVDESGRPLYYARMYAVDWLGGLHRSPDPVRSGDAMYDWPYLNPAYVRSVRLVVIAPYQWVTFREQPLSPRSSELYVLP